MATIDETESADAKFTDEKLDCSGSSNENHVFQCDDSAGEDEDLSLGDEEDGEEGELGQVTSLASIHEIQQHASYNQVILDVNRCAGRLEHIRRCYLHRTDEDDEPPEDLTEDLQRLSSDDDDDRISAISGECDSTPNHVMNDDNEKLQRIAKDLQYQRRLKKKLAKLIVRLLLRKPGLHYYQGFHDVCLTYMTIHGEHEALSRLDKLIDSHFSIFMQPTMNETQEFLALIPIIIGLHDQRVSRHLEQAEVGTIFALSWAITWFSHVIPNQRDVECIFKRLESIDDPHLILYLCAEIVLYKTERLLELEPEMSSVHHFLCQIPRKEKLPIAELMKRASESYEKWPPEFVKTRLSRYRREKLQLYNYNLVQSFAQRFIPALTSLVTSPNSRRALVVFVVASALALNFDRWMR